MSWFSKLFGSGDKSIDVESAPATQKTDSEPHKDDDSYALAWRNRYLTSRILHLEKKTKKKNISGVIKFNMPEDVESGSPEDLLELNAKLQKRVEYLESFLKGL